ncbi:hypothetical protein BU25DRAFT_389536 [Macroventuria anomochaeta]|uniref:Uncharacterized protein n=1 Tax=Macroventuria anomochaeta TaxID=301207 RepID=A0ACB6S8C2_9PLEO|nr:uncharacterized protein BU25DRAFT_389536 [Macroventuria anomochaeta]KAF2629377.1 hypothetical protein BU25DRAFT_389536 [Macroventuria anomochaeta]
MRSSDREFRLLDLLPGVGDEAIRCATRVVSLDRHPDYETMSYVWGDRREEKDIEVSGNPVPITENLYAGLLRLRYSTKKRTLWIDQICINQWDLEEKAAQVALMRDIYRKCTRCVTWMGDLERDGYEVQIRDAEAVFDFLRQVAAAKIIPLAGLPVLFQQSDEGSAARRAFEMFSMYGNPCARSCDYTIAAPRLFAKVTLDLIKYEGGLRSLLGACEMPHITPNAPTWAIDFACCNRIGKRQLKWWGHSHRYKVFSASRDNELQVFNSLGDEVLGLSGINVDAVLDTSELLRVDAQDAIYLHDLREPLANCILLIDQYRASQYGSQVYKDGLTWDSAFCRTLVGDLIMDELPLDRIGSYGRTRLQADFTHLWHMRKQEHDVFPDLYESLVGMMENQTFFITKSGYIGIGPPQIKPGDQVWVFNGGNVPFVMRKIKKEAEDCPQLALVGDAYVHGIMDGEALNDEPHVQTVCVH